MLSAALILAILLLTALTSSAAPVRTQTLRLQLFNDSSCTAASMLPTADISQPISASGLGTCVTAPSFLLQAGYSSYQAACGTSTNNRTFVYLLLWLNSSTNATTCPGSASFNTFLSAGDSSLTHTASSCVGPVRVMSLVDRTNLISSFGAYAQFDCGSPSPNAAHVAADTASVPAIVLLLLLVLLSGRYSSVEVEGRGTLLGRVGR